MKLRGSEFSPGQHAYRLSADGPDVFPRLADVPEAGDYSFTARRVSSGIAALDEMLADGCQPGTSTLCAGPSGTGKTLMGLHFLYNVAAAGECGVLANLMTAELPDLFETAHLSEHGISHLADNVVLLEYVREEAVLRRALTVLKTRASRHEPETREYTITADGIVLEPVAARAP